MAQFSLPNIQTGGSQTITANTLADAQAQAQSAGTWNPGAGTYGANSILGTGGTSAPTGAGTPQGSNDPLAALQQFAAQTSGVTQKQLEQQKAEFDAQLQFAQQQMQQLGIPQLQINQFLAQMQQEQFQSQLALAQQAQAYNQAATTAGLTGWYTAPQPVPNVSGYTNQPTWQPGQPLQAGSLAGGGAVGATGTGGTGGLNLSQYEGTAIRSSDDPAHGTQYLVRNGQLYAIPNGAAGASIFGTDAYNKGAYAQTTVNIPNATLANMAGSVSDTGQLIAPATAAATTPAAPSTPVQTTVMPPTATTPAQPQMTMQLGQLLGNYMGMPTEQAREFNANLGQQYLATAAQLQGPQNTFQLSNYLRGAQGNQAVPTYLQNLASGVGNAMFQGAGSTAPTLQSAAGIASQLGGGSSATPGWDYNQTLNTIQNIMSGAQKLAPGSIEQLTPDELQALGSGIGAAGGTLPSFLAQYNASRVGQAAPVARATLA